MKGRGYVEEEEKRSYGAVFLLSIALLLACTVWALWQDSFSRHLWKRDRYLGGADRVEQGGLGTERRVRGAA